MLPELFRIGWFALPTYGALLGVGFLAALWLFRRRSGLFGSDAETATDLGVWILLAGLVGARVLLVIVEWPHYVTSWEAAKGLIRAGGVFYGGLIGATLVAALFLRSRKLDFWRVADAAAPCVALGQAIGRLGCFAAGCCWGRACDLPWAVTFTSEVAEKNVGVPLHVPLHPTQLYESLGAFALTALLLFFEKRRFVGETFGRYLVGYALLRGTIELFRGDPRGSLFSGALSTSQFIALAGLAAGVLILVLRRSRRAEPAAA